MIEQIEQIEHILKKINKDNKLNYTLTLNPIHYSYSIVKDYGKGKTYILLKPSHLSEVLAYIQGVEYGIQHYNEYNKVVKPSSVKETRYNKPLRELINLIFDISNIANIFGHKVSYKDIISKIYVRDISLIRAIFVIIALDKGYKIATIADAIHRNRQQIYIIKKAYKDGEYDHATKLLNKIKHELNKQTK